MTFTSQETQHPELGAPKAVIGMAAAGRDRLVPTRRCVFLGVPGITVEPQTSLWSNSVGPLEAVLRLH